MNTYETINDILVHLFNEIWELEEIGLGEGSPMSAIAKKMNVTAGTLTTSMNSLVNKKYAVRERSEEDRRVVYIKLTEKGKKAYEHHAQFHHQMTEAVIKKLNEEEIPVLLKTLEGLSEFFRNYH